MNKNDRRLYYVVNTLGIPLGFGPGTIRNTSDKDTWGEARAREQIYRLSGIAYLGALPLLGIDGNLDIVKVLVSFNLKTGNRKQLMDRAIEARLACVDSLCADKNFPDLQLIGLAGLGLLKSLDPNKRDISQWREEVVKILAEKDRKAHELCLEYPEIF